MRSSLFLLLAAPLVVACGDDDGGKITVPDAKVFMDAPPVPCSVDESMGTLATGSMQARRMGDWFDVIPSGPAMGRTYFYVLGVAPSSVAPGAIDAVFVEYLKPTQGGFVTGSPLDFNTDPTSAGNGVAAYVVGDLNANTGALTHFYWASNGSMTLTNIGESDGSMITGSITQTNFREVNEMTGADIPGGCTTSIAGMTFALTQMASAANGKSFDNDDIPQQTIDAIMGHVQRFKSRLAQQ